MRPCKRPFLRRTHAASCLLIASYPPTCPPSAAELHIVLRNLHPLTTFECRLVRDHARHGHVQSFTDIHNRLSIQENGFDEVIGQRPVRAFMTAAADTGRQRGTRTIDLVVLRFLTIYAAIYAVSVSHVPADRHP